METICTHKKAKNVQFVLVTNSRFLNTFQQLQSEELGSVIAEKMWNLSF